MPGSRLGPWLSSVVLGLAGRATLPEVPWSAGGLTLSRVSFVVPVVLCGADGEAGLVFVSSADGVSDGEVFALCMLLSPLRPCEARRCFLIFLSFEDELGTDSVALPAADSPLFTLPELSLPTPVDCDAPPRLGTALDEVSRFEESSGCAWWVFLESVSAGGVALLAGLLLGRLLFDDEEFEELPGRALLFWSAGRTALPLSSVDWLFGVAVLRVSLVPVPVAVCARAPNAASTSANAAAAMIFMESPYGFRRLWRFTHVNPTDEGPVARSTKREAPARPSLSTPDEAQIRRRTTIRNRRCAWHSGS